MSVQPDEPVDDEYRERVRQRIEESFTAAKKFKEGIEKPGNPGVTAS